MISGTLAAMTTFQDSLVGPMTRAEVVAELGERRTRALLASGRLLVLWPGILVPAELFFDPMTRATGALRLAGPEAALVGTTAAWLHGCPVASSLEVHVGVPYLRSVRSREGLIVHQGRRLLDEVLVVQGLRSVPLVVAVAELLCTARRRDALAIADQATALFAAAEQPRFRGQVAERLAARPDRRGAAQADELLALVTGCAASPPESWLRLLVVDAGFPPPLDQFEVVDLQGRVRYVLDMCWPRLRIALEYDGYEAHEAREFEDAQRDEDLARRGWITVRARAADLRDPARLLDELRETFRARGATTGPATGLHAAARRSHRRSGRW